MEIDGLANGKNRGVVAQSTSAVALVGLTFSPTMLEGALSLTSAFYESLRD